MSVLFAFSVSLGRYARSLLRSGLLETLLEEPAAQAVIFSPGAEDPEFVSEFERSGRVRVAPLVDEPIGRTRWERLLWKACNAAGFSPTLYRAALEVRHRIYRAARPRHYGEALAAQRPDLLITASAGFSTTRDVPLIREAKAAGIPTLYVVHSWDNLTGLKGIMLERPDRLAVWNEIMKEEAVRKYHYRPEEVEVVGALQLDHYTDPDTFLPKEVFLASLKLDPNRPVVTLAAGMPKIDSSFLIERVLALTRRGAFRPAPQFLFRPHPIQPFRYEQFEQAPELRFDRFARVSNGLGWNPTLAESIHVANLMRHSDVVVNIASTVTLEACLADTPVVNVAYDELHPEAFRHHIHRDHWKRHFQVVGEEGATWIAENDEMLVEGINLFLKEPAHQREARRRLAERICGPRAGKAHQRVAALARRMAAEGRRCAL